VEAVLAVTLLAVIATTLVGVAVMSSRGTVRAGEHSRALSYASEGLEAVRSVRDDDWSNVTGGSYGVAMRGGEWQLQANSTSENGFTRTIDITELSTSRREVAAEVTWTDVSDSSRSVTLTTRMTNWQDSVGEGDGGGDGEGDDGEDGPGNSEGAPGRGGDNPGQGPPS